MTAKKGGYQYVPVRFAKSLENYPSAGPYPNITGMRNKYWGQDAYIIRCGAYVYKVPSHVFLALSFGDWINPSP